MNIPRTRHEFGRHETFTLREGWLNKGLDHLTRTGDFKADTDTADTLGVGKNMVKSLLYWMEATGLAERDAAPKASAPVSASPLAAMIERLDPHFEYSVTTWYVHMLLARRGGSVWNWFFNDFRNGVFDRETCVEGFQRHVRNHSLNQTTPTVLQREVACLLGTYAATSNEKADPEDFTLSPLRALSLLVKHADTGRFEKTTPLDAIPVEAFVACVGLLARDAGSATLPLSDLISRRNSPARLFNMDGDAIDALSHRAVELHGARGVSISLLGSTRNITVPPGPAEVWYKAHFDRIGGKA